MVMTNPGPGGQVMPRRLSKAALASLIFGIIGCVPFVTGALALLFGLIGFFTAGGPFRRGRWMAVVGSLLGMVSLIFWILFGSTLLALVVAAGSKTVAVMA